MVVALDCGLGGLCGGPGWLVLISFSLVVNSVCRFVWVVGFDCFIGGC